MLSDKVFDPSIADYIHSLGRKAQQASRAALSLTTLEKNKCLALLAQKLQEAKADIVQENRKDLQLAKSKKLSDALIDRLEISEGVFQSMLEGIHTVIDLNDPIGEISHLAPRPSGIRVGKLRAPIGVITMIYESRPNVTIDAAILNIKAGNAVILRGGSEAFHSNMALNTVIQQTLSAANMPPALVQQVENTSRDSVHHLIRMNDYVDLVIPRGGKGLIEKIAQDSRINVLKHLDGNCHVYIDKTADPAMAEAIAWNAKTRRYGVCNAMESLLAHQQVAADILPPLLNRLHKHGVALRLCQQSLSFVQGLSNVKPATEQDWKTEYLGPILSVKVVDSFNQAVEHINLYGSHHTDAIVAQDYARGQEFLARIDSSSVMVNASTAFADGAEYGLGAEIGISTDKFHARGPVGIEGLTCQKYIVLGNGDIRE